MGDIIIGVFGCAFILIIIFFGSCQATNKRELERAQFCTGKTVEEVGGCNSSGRCGIRLSSGEYTEMHFPVKGQPCH